MFLFDAQKLKILKNIKYKYRQSLLLGDDEYRQKMVNDAMSRRNDDNTNTKKIVSSWEVDDDDNNTNKIAKINTDTMSEEEIRKQKFKNKRKAHYNEFHAIKAWRAKQQNADNDINE